MCCQFYNLHKVEVKLNWAKMLWLCMFNGQPRLNQLSILHEVLRVMLLKIQVFWDVTLCYWVSNYKYLEGIISEISGTTHSMKQPHIHKDVTPQLCLSLAGNNHSWRYWKIK